MTAQLLTVLLHSKHIITNRKVLDEFCISQNNNERFSFKMLSKRKSNVRVQQTSLVVYSYCGPTLYQEHSKSICRPTARQIRGISLCHSGVTAERQHCYSCINPIDTLRFRFGESTVHGRTTYMR